MTEQDGIRYPDVHVKLSGTDGNTMAMIGRVAVALARAGHADVTDEFALDITSAETYDEAVQKIMHWVDVS